MIHFKLATILLLSAIPLLAQPEQTAWEALKTGLAEKISTSTGRR